MSKPRKLNLIKKLTNRLEVMTTNGEVFLASIHDEPLIRSRTWRAVYARRGFYVNNFFTVKGKQSVIGLHRFLMNPPEGIQVDHVNGKKHDNRRENLRLATPQQNSRNHHLICVRQIKSGKWLARITLDRKQGTKHIGHFDTKEEALAARQAAVDLHFGEFARKR